MNANDDMFELNLQAYLDGELSAPERAEVERLMAANPSHRQLLEELRFTKAALSGNGSELKVPETREFYWSKISRQIESESRSAQKTGKGGVGALVRMARRHLMGLAGATFAACLAVIMWIQPSGVPQVAAKEAELELASDDMGSYTFRDHEQQATMVWLYDRNGEDADAANSAKAIKAKMEEPQ